MADRVLMVQGATIMPRHLKEPLATGASTSSTSYTWVAMALTCSIV